MDVFQHVHELSGAAGIEESLALREPLQPWQIRMFPRMNFRKDLGLMKH